MQSTPIQQSLFKLSICITTLNRAAFIGATLDSIISQLTAECELLVVDGASTDDTEMVVAEYARRCNRLRYVRLGTNSGFDRDCDRSMELACGEYCWLMTDDDLLKAHAVAAVLQAIDRDFSLIIVNAETKDTKMKKVLRRRWLDFESDRIYGPGEMDRLFVEVGDTFKYVGSIIVKRAIWLGRERARYYDSMFVYLGVIFQKQLPGRALVLAEPFISYRGGNAHAWWPQVSEIWLVKWPSLVDSMALSESAKRRVHSVHPWRHIPELLWFRALGLYSMNEYQHLIRPRLPSIRERLIPTLVALLPGVLVNALLTFYYWTHRRLDRLQLMRSSRYSLRKWSPFKVDL